MKYTQIVEEKALSKPNTTPIVLFTSPKKSLVFGKPKYTNPSFEVFKKLNSKSLTYISCKTGINHESFISLGTCRASYPSSNSFIDGETLHKEFVQFQKITRLTLDLLKNHTISNYTIPIQEIHERDFLIENCNLCKTIDKQH
ncbi:MAG: hypothetical protein HRU40_03040 [Saprospiraceae bacterium]|nr:hypothetical protein [Saprospiraceae bacterium]